MSVSATSLPVTNGSEKVVIRVLCIYYPVQFQEEQVRALLDGSSEVNAMSPIYAKRLGFKTRKTNVRAQKIVAPLLRPSGW